MSIQNRIFKKFEDFTFFQIYIETKTGNILEDFKDILTADEIKKLDKNKIIRIRNNDNFLTIDNWNKLKDIFFSQRMETYNSSYTDVEKINLELEDLNKIPINKPEYKTLKKRYKKYLLSKLKQPQQTETKQPDEVKKELHNHIFKDKAFEVWQSMFDEFEIDESSRTDVKFMFEEMKKEKLIHHTVNQINFLEWIYSTYSLNIEKTSNHSRTKARRQAFSRAMELYKL